MKWLITACAVIKPTMVVEADTEEEAIKKAIEGDTVPHLMEDAHLPSAKLVYFKRWRAEPL